MLKQCSECGDECLKKPTNIFRSTGRTVYVDESGRAWVGLKCPGCASNSVKLRVKVTIRKCRCCKKKLPNDRYFTHGNCEPGRGNTSYTQEDWGYAYGG